MTRLSRVTKKESSSGFKYLLMGLALAIVLCLAYKANAADATTTIAVVDTQKVFQEAKAVKNIRKQIDKKAETYRKQSAKKEEYFKKKYAELEKKKSVLSKEAFDEKNTALAKEFGETQKKVQGDRTSLEKAYVESMKQVEAKFSEVVKEEASKQGATVVIHKMQTLYSADSLDITNSVLEGLNKKLSKVKVKFK